MKELTYLPEKMLNYDSVISTKEQYDLVRIIEEFKHRINNVIENKKSKFEREDVEGDEITSNELNYLINILSDIENRKRPITRIAYNRALNILQQDIKHLPVLKNIFKSKGLVKNIAFPIENILANNSSENINEFVSYIRGKDQVTVEEVANSNTPAGSVEKYFSSLPSGLVKSLFNLTVPGGGGKGVGKGELALILLLKGASHPTVGDVEVPTGKIEVKQGKGLEESAGRLSASKNIYGDVKSAFINNFSNIFAEGDVSVIKEFKTSYWYNLNEKNLKIFILMLKNVIEKNPNTLMRNPIVTAYKNSINIYLKQFFKPELISLYIEDSFDSQGLPIKERLVKNVFKLCYLHYQQQEQFKYFAVYKDGELFLKEQQNAFESIDMPGGLTYADTPDFQDSRSNAFKVTFNNA
jgi:arsenate reductase-like glutaredoxin family protein